MLFSQIHHSLLTIVDDHLHNISCSSVRYTDPLELQIIINPQHHCSIIWMHCWYCSASDDDCPTLVVCNSDTPSLLITDDHRLSHAVCFSVWYITPNQPNQPNNDKQFVILISVIFTQRFIVIFVKCHRGTAFVEKWLTAILHIKLYWSHLLLSNVTHISILYMCML